MSIIRSVDLEEVLDGLGRREAEEAKAKTVLDINYLGKQICVVYLYILPNL